MDLHTYRVTTYADPRYPHTETVRGTDVLDAALRAGVGNAGQMASIRYDFARPDVRDERRTLFFRDGVLRAAVERPGEEAVRPAAGTAATKVYPQDAYPMVVTWVSASGKTARLAPVVDPQEAGVVFPRDERDPYPVDTHTYAEGEWLAVLRQSVQRYTPEHTPSTVMAAGEALDNWQTVTVRRGDDGRWYTPGGRRNGTPHLLGTATYRRDWRI